MITHLHLFFQLPTPTALPPGVPIVMLDPHNFNMWSRTGDMIQVWNYSQATGVLVQTGVLIILIGAFLSMCLMYLNKIQEER